MMNPMRQNKYKWSRNRLCLTLTLTLTLMACTSAPNSVDWQLQTKGSVERSVAAYLQGNTRIEDVEFSRAKAEVSGTGRVDLMARVELLRCASRVASLVFEPCAGFENLRRDAPPAERAYANYLAAITLEAQDAALLPAQQQAALSGGDAAIQAISEPLSQLVAAGVALQSGQASAALVQRAVDTASGQGWRRPLLAWLSVQARLFDKSGDVQGAERIRRRIMLAQGNRPAAPAPSPAVAARDAASDRP